MAEFVSHHLGDVGCGVKEEREPAHECGDLNDTHPSDRFRKVSSCFVNCADDVAEFSESALQASQLTICALRICSPAHPLLASNT